MDFDSTNYNTDELLNILEINQSGDFSLDNVFNKTKSSMDSTRLSDDMDMFVYGCTRVLRNISLINKTVILYETPIILKELCMPEEHFKQIMVLSGTDYNTNTLTSLDTTISWYSKYKLNFTDIMIEEIPSFYDWLLVNSDYISDIDNLLTICQLFTIHQLSQDPSLEKFEIILNNRNDKLLHDIMEKEGFVFT